jgi:hypothetical protein
MAAVLAAACSCLALVACSENKVGPTTYVTVGAPPPPTTTSAAAASSSPMSSTEPVRAMHKLPGQCASLLPPETLTDALGHKVSGRTAFVVGLPDPTTGRVSYINCRYGVESRANSADPRIEIGVSLYRTPQKAAARIAPTIDAYTAHAAHATKADVGGHQATVLTGGQGSGYGPTVVMAVGQRTIAVSLRPHTVAAARVQHDLTTLAALANSLTSG